MKRLITALLLFIVGYWWRQRAQQNATSIKNKVVIITGASAGIGKRTAHAFAQAGAHVVLVARREALLNAVEAELAPYNVQTCVIPADITVDADVQRIIEATRAQFGRVDVLVNNAGVLLSGHFETFDPARIKQTIDVNLYAPIRLTQAVLPIMKQQQGGYIVNVASIAGRVMSPSYAVYSPTKAALIAFGDALRRETIGTGVHITTCMPGWVRTDMIPHISHESIRKMGFSPLLFPIFEADEIAQDIVDAVRHRRLYSIRVGIGFRCVLWLEQVAPRVVDGYYHLFVNPERHIDGMANNGDT